MNLYHIWQGVHLGYDMYDGAIVAAESIEIARTIHPRYGSIDNPQYHHNDGWVDPANVEVELIGTAVEGTEQGVILASFNAG